MKYILRKAKEIVTDKWVWVLILCFFLFFKTEWFASSWSDMHTTLKAWGFVGIMWLLVKPIVGFLNWAVCKIVFYFAPFFK